jgi:recombinational DNA repair ATPase RecF
MRIERIAMRDFRSYEEAELTLGPGLTIVYGANGAGKTNLVEALYFGCTARSFRTTNERNLVRFGAAAARVVLSGSDGRRPTRAGGRVRPRRAEAHEQRRRARGAPSSTSRTARWRACSRPTASS